MVPSVPLEKKSGPTLILKTTTVHDLRDDWFGSDIMMLGLH